MSDHPVVGILKRTDTVLESLRGKRFEKPRHYADAMALFDRSHNLFKAIRHLVAADFVHEAAVLVRPLLTDSLFLTDIAAGNEKERAAALVGWELQTNADWEGMIKEAVARGGSDGSDLEVFEARRKWLGQYLVATGLFEPGEMPRQRKPDGDVKRMADEHGRGDEYLDYRTMNHFVHGSTFAAHARYAPSIIEGDEGGEIELGGAAADLAPYREGVLLLSAQAVLCAARATSVLFDVHEPDDLAALLADIESHAEENNRASASSAASGSSSSPRAGTAQ